MLRDIAVFLILYLVFRLIRNIFNPVKATSTTFQSQAGPTSNYYNRTEEGRVEVKDVPNPKSNAHHKNDNDGEYIDYKEVNL